MDPVNLEISRNEIKVKRVEEGRVNAVVIEAQKEFFNSKIRGFSMIRERFMRLGCNRHATTVLFLVQVFRNGPYQLSYPTSSATDKESITIADL